MKPIDLNDIKEQYKESTIEETLTEILEIRRDNRSKA